MFDKYTVVYQLLKIFRLNIFAEKYRCFFNRFWKHYNYHSKEEWKKIFNKAGFEVTEAMEYASKGTCLLNDFMVPFALPAFVTKRVTNKWILSKRLRKWYLFPIFKFVKKVIDKCEHNKDGGIVFFSLIKG